MVCRPTFIVTIDVEADNVWARNPCPKMENLQYLNRFQTLCDSHGLQPTYLVNSDVAREETFQRFGHEVLKRKAGEIGMHLHAWDNLSGFKLTDQDFRHHPYLIDFPPEVIRHEVEAATAMLEKIFDVKMVSHRAGRWALNATYAQALVDNGYLVDCSVTPHYSWADHAGAPDGPGGCDYCDFPDRAYFLDLDDISRPGTSPLLEVPLTIRSRSYGLFDRLRTVANSARFIGRFLDCYLPTHDWMRPNGRNLGRMIGILNWSRARNVDHVEFMMHSSEFMPGGSPRFPTSETVELLFADLEVLFAAVNEHFRNMTLGEYRRSKTVTPEHHADLDSGKLRL